MPSRRHFLKLAGGSALAAGLSSHISDIQALVDTQAGHAAGLDFEHLSDQYSLAPSVSYLNHGSIGTIPRAVHKAHVAYLQLCETNPWLHVWGGAWNASRDQVRSQAAGLLQCPADNLALIHNVTEAFNLLSQGLPLQSGDEVLFSSLNHSGASVCWYHQAKRRGFSVKTFEFPFTDINSLSVEDVVSIYAEQVTEKTRVLVFPHIDNTLGLRHPMAELNRMAKAKGVRYVCVDGAQTYGMLPLDVVNSGIDVYAASPHKWIQAPKGLGIAYIQPDLYATLEPMWVTWGNAGWKDSIRAYEDYGTRNWPELMALGDALHFQQQLGEQRKVARYRQLREYVMSKVESTVGLEWHSPVDWQLSGSLYAIRLAKGTASDIATRLFEQHGIVLRPFDGPGLNTLRLSPNVFTTTGEIDQFIQKVQRLTT